MLDMEFVVVIDMPHNRHQPPHPPNPSAASSNRKTINLQQCLISAYQGHKTSLSSLHFDCCHRCTIYSVYNSDVMYKRGKKTYTNIFIIKRKKSLLLKTT